MTNQEKFIQTFGVDAWRQMIVFCGCAEQFKDFWTSPYKDDSMPKDYPSKKEEEE